MKHIFYVPDENNPGHFRQATVEDFGSQTVPAEVARSIADNYAVFLKELYDKELQQKNKATTEMGDEIGRLADALEPFADFGAAFDGQQNEVTLDSQTVYVFNRVPITLGHLRKAVTTMNRPGIREILDLFRHGADSEVYKRS